MDTKEPELLVKLAEKISNNTITDEELDFFVKEFHKLVKSAGEDIQADTLKAKIKKSILK